MICLACVLKTLGTMAYLVADVTLIYLLILIYIICRTFRPYRCMHVFLHVSNINSTCITKKFRKIKNKCSNVNCAL